MFKKRTKLLLLFMLLIVSTSLVSATDITVCGTYGAGAI